VRTGRVNCVPDLQHCGVATPQKPMMMIMMTMNVGGHMVV
jgi:hypothetical protein